MVLMITVTMASATLHRWLGSEAQAIEKIEYRTVDSPNLYNGKNTFWHCIWYGRLPTDLPEAISSLKSDLCWVASSTRDWRRESWAWSQYFKQVGDLLQSFLKLFLCPLSQLSNMSLPSRLHITKLTTQDMKIWVTLKLSRISSSRSGAPGNGM